MEQEKTKIKKPMSARRIITYAVVLAAVVAGGIFGWRYYQDLQAHIETDDAQVEGNIVPVITRTAGYVSKIYLDDNQVVAQGQRIVELDTLELRAKLEQAIAAYKSAQSSVEVARSGVANASSARRLARTSIESPKINLQKSQSDFARYEDLYNQKLATPQQFESIQAARDNAKAQLALASQQYEETDVQYQTALNQVKVAEANLNLRAKDVEYARLQLSYTKITAPVGGVISKKTIQTGQLVQSGQPLMSIVQDKQIWVTANFKETQLADMKVGQPVEIKVDAYPDIHFSGKVESFGGATGAKFSLLPPDNASGNYVKVVQRVSVRIAIDKTPEVDKYLRPGLSVTARVTKTS